MKKQLLVIVSLVIGLSGYTVWLQNSCNLGNTGNEVMVIADNYMGTGTYIETNEILTAHHVVKDSSLDKIYTIENEKTNHVIRIKLVQGKDVAVLVMSTPRSHVNAPRTSNRLPRAGDSLHYSGYLKSGLMGLQRREAKVMGYFKGYILLDLTSSHGESGSAVYDDDNNLVGIAIYRISNTWCGILPVSAFKELL